MKVVVLKMLKFLDEIEEWKSADEISQHFNMTRQEAAQYLVILRKVGLVISDGNRCRMNGQMKPVLYSSIRCGGEIMTDESREILQHEVALMVLDKLCSCPKNAGVHLIQPECQA